MKAEEIDALLGGEAQRLADQYRSVPVDFMDGYGWAITQVCRMFADAENVIRRKDCKHRPTIDGEYLDGFDIIFPDWRCPCRCDDGWYNWMPKDDWFCGNGERKEE